MWLGEEEIARESPRLRLEQMAGWNSRQEGCIHQNFYSAGHRDMARIRHCRDAWRNTMSQGSNGQQ